MEPYIPNMNHEKWMQLANLMMQAVQDQDEDGGNLDLIRRKMRETCCETALQEFVEAVSE